MSKTTKDLAREIVVNDLTWPKMVMIQFLTSLFKHHDNFDWSDDLKKTSIAVLGNDSSFDDLNESADRIIVMRQAFNAQNIATDYRTKVNGNMYTHEVIKPKLGYLNIFCESRNSVHVEYIASLIENVLMLHRDDLLEKNLLIGEAQLSDVREPLSGTGFYSLMISVPTYISGTVEFSIDNPRMVSSIEIEWSLGI